MIKYDKNIPSIKIYNNDSNYIFEITHANNFDILKIKLNNDSAISFGIEKNTLDTLLRNPLFNCLSDDIETISSTRLFFDKNDPEIIQFLNIENLDKYKDKELIMLYLKISIKKDFEYDNAINVKISYELSFLENKESMFNISELKTAMKNKIKPVFQYQPIIIRLNNNDVLSFLEYKDNLNKNFF